MNYKAAVEKGKQLVSAINTSKWELGDLALEVAPMGKDTSNNGSSEKLARFASEIGIEFNTLLEYRRVANAWPLARRLATASWSVHQELTGQQDVLRRLAAENKGVRITVDMARLARGNAPTRYPRPEPRRAVYLDHDDDTDIDTGTKDAPSLTDNPAWQESHANLEASQVGRLLEKAIDALDDAVVLLRQPGVADKTTWFEPSYERLAERVKIVGSYVRGESVSQAAEDILRGLR